MDDQGIDYVPPDRNRSLANSSLLGVVGFLDVQSASTEGYGLISAASAPTATESASFDRAYQGVSPTTVSASGDSGEVSLTDSGCLGDANASIYGDLQETVRAMVTQNDFLLAANNGIGADADRVIAAPLAEYSTCMAKLGRNFQSPDAALDYARVEFLRTDSEESPTTAELAFATDDARCQSNAHYLDVADRIALDAASDWIVKHADEIESLSRWRDATIARAASVP